MPQSHKIGRLILEAMEIPDPGEVVAKKARSPQWPKIMGEHLSEHPECAACGGDEDLNVHHIVPYHLDPSRELDPENLITLCRFHHFDLGHLGHWVAWCPVVFEIASLHRLAYRLRAVFMKYEKGLPVENEP